MDPFNSEGNQDVNKAAQKMLDAVDAEQVKPNDGELLALTELGNPQFTINSILANTLQTVLPGAPTMRNEPFAANAGYGSFQFDNIQANNHQAISPGTQMMQSGASAEIPPNLMSLLFGANRLQTLLSSYAAASGLPTPSPSLTNSSASSLTNSANPSPSAMDCLSDTPNVNGLWNNVPTTWLMNNAYRTQGTQSFPSTAPASLAISADSSPAIPNNFLNTLTAGAPNNFVPWNHYQPAFMNLSNSLYASQTISGQGSGTFSTPAASSTLQGPTRTPRPRKKRCPVRNAVDRYRRAWRREIKKKRNAPAITIGTKEYERKLNQAMDHYITSPVNNNEFLKEILHFLNPHLINPFTDFQENFPRRKSMQTPTPRKLYAEYMSRVKGDSEYKKFNELEEEKSEEYYKWCKLAEMVQQEVLKQIEKGFITKAV
ncbi:unnamed protein product [Caenorhabditis brenneri]